MNKLERLENYFEVWWDALPLWLQVIWGIVYLPIGIFLMGVIILIGIPLFLLSPFIGLIIVMCDKGKKDAPTD